MKRSFTLTFLKRLKPLGFGFSLGAFLGTLALISLTLFLCFGLYEARAKTRFLEAKEKEKAALMRLKPNPPSKERLEFLENQKKLLGKLSGQIMRAPFFWPKLSYPNEERLEFKEELHALRERLEKVRALRNVVVEKEAELPDFKEALPPKEELPRLFMAIKLSEELRAALFESGVQRIVTLNFPEARTEDLGDGITRFEYPFGLTLDTNWWNLMRLIQALQGSAHPWKFERITIENQLTEGATQGIAEAPLRVEIGLSSLFYGRRSEGERA